MDTNATRKHGGARRPTKFRRRVLPVLVAACFTGNAFANPFGAQVVNGQASISTQGNVLSVTNTPGAIINWQGFSINQGETTRFIQQNTSSAVLNRITGQDPSQILGTLQSNGRVFLINPNGILFGQGAQVDVNGFVASTLNITNEDFLNGRMFFNAGDRAGNIRNQGAITTPAGGKVYLIAPNIENSGIITSPRGEVLLAAGRTVQLVDSMNPDLHVVVSAPDNEALNLGQVIAQGGKTGIYGALVRQRGIVNANSAVVGEDGKVVLKASRDTYLEAGSRTTATGAGTGGEVHVLGNRVAVTGDARIDASGQFGGGSVLIGGDYRGQNADIQNASVSFVSSDAQVKADAIQDGNGGKVVVWGNDITRAFGDFSAKGGANAGNGGLVETSAHYLEVDGIRVNTSAPAGNAGTWLLDPYDITITSSATSLANYTGTGANVDPFLWTATGTSIISSATITTQLDSVKHVVVDTTGVGTDQGNINVTSAMSLTNAGASSLTLKANNNINISANISGNLDSLKLMANQDAAGGGDVNFNANVSTTSLDVSADNVSFGGTVSANSAKFTVNGGISQGVGTVSFSNLELLGTGNVTLGNSGNTLGAVAGSVAGNINLTSNSAITVSTVGGSTGLASTAGNVRLESATNLNLNQPITATGAVKLQSLGGVTDGNAGAINVTASSLDIAAASNSSLHSQVSSLSGGTLTSVTGSAPTAFMALGAGDLTINGIAIGAVAAGTDAATQAANLTVAINAESASTGVYAYVPASGDKVVLANTGGAIVVALAGVASTANTGLAAGATAMPNATFTIDNTGNLSITKFSTSTLGLTNSGNVTQTGAISATNFGVKALGDVTLNSVTNSVSYLAAELGDVSNKNKNFRFKNGTSGLTIGTGIAGLTGITINMDGSYDPLSPNGYIVLQSGGALMQSAGALLAGKAVYAEGSSVDLTQSNPIGVIAGKATGLAAADRFMYTSFNGIMVDRVAGINGVSHAGVIDDQSIVLTAGAGGISQRALPGDTFEAPITSANGGGLKAVTSGTVMLKASGNNVGRFMGANTSGINFVNNTNLILGLDGSTGVSTASNQSIKISANGLVTVAEAVSAGTGNVMLEADSLTLTKTVTGGVVSLSPRTAGRPITIGSTTCNAVDGTGSCLRITNLSNVVAPNIGIGSEPTDSNPAGAIHVAGITTGVATATDRLATTMRIGLLTGAGITQSGAISVQDLGVSAGDTVNLTHVNNQVTNLAARTTGDNFSFTNKQALEITTLAGGTTPHDYSISGITTAGGNVSVVTNTAGGIKVSNAINAGAGSITLDTAGNIDVLAGLTTSTASSTTLNSGGAINGGGIITSGTLTADATSGIGNITQLSTAVSSMDVANTGASTGINISNSGNLNLTNASQGATSSGSISIVNSGDLSVGSVSTDAGAISLTAYHSMAVNGTVSSNSGAITLAAVGTGTPGNGDALNVYGWVTSNSGSILLSAGDDIVIADPTHVTSSTGTVTKSPNLNGPVTPPPPTLTQCVDNPTLSGCSAVLPSLSSCVANPSQTGCSVVLPSLATCTADPTVAGCSVVLPSFETCIASPTHSGCSVVLPSLATCTADPAVAGCTVVLPSLNTCIANPSLSGCSAVLPSLTACTADPTVAGCTAVLPSLSTCIANPSQSGCSAVLPSLTACTVDPTVAGCTTVLPSLSTCIANPSQSGCSAVLPSLTACTADPTVAGCTAVLPSLSTCIANPAQSGCSAVLPTLASCTADPTVTGCTVVLPSLNTCIAAPAQAGCSVVLPSLSTCIANPIETGCSVVLPSLNTCIATPTQTGCTVVLPSLNTCIVNPSQAGCTVVLPSLNTCIVNPSQAGCTVVLPSLSNCIADPAQAGCAVVLPSLNICIANPTQAGCTVVLPSLNTCIANPSQTGCTVVLPSLNTCIANPSQSGCSVVLPSLTSCISNPAQSGCSAVLPTVEQCNTVPLTTGCTAVPTMSSCITRPTLPGCSSVLPTLAACSTNPALTGCSVVLPSLNSCIAGPAQAGCSVVLPSLNTCIATPTLTGCTVILPPISACIANPTQSGCSVVLPSLDSCIANPMQTGCSVMLPTLATCTQSPVQKGCSVVLPTLDECMGSSTIAGCSAILSSTSICLRTPTAPECQAVAVPPAQTSQVSSVENSVVLLSTTSTTARPSSLASTPAGSANAPASSTSTTASSQATTSETRQEEKTDDKKDEKKTTSSVDDSGAKENEPAKKMYCN